MKPIFVLLTIILLGNCYAQQKVAFVVGNNNYKEYPLKNAGNDAVLMTATLKKLGFTVQQVMNATKTDLEKQLLAFNRNYKNAEMRFFYYAGHGIQFEGENFLIPVDAGLEEKEDVRIQGLNFRTIFAMFQNSKPGAMNIFIMDACRNNPFKNRSWGTRSGGDEGGLVLKKNDFAAGSFAAFSADNGQKASDGEGTNGLYTKILAETMLEPGLEINIMFQKIRSKVIRLSGGAQTPIEENRLISEAGFFFLPAGDKPVPQPTDIFKKFYYYTDQNGKESPSHFNTRQEAEAQMRSTKLYGKVYSNTGEAFVVEGPVLPVGKTVVAKEAIRQKLTDAKNHYEKNVYDKAFAIYNTMEEADLNAVAKYHLGYMYDIGHGVSQDYIQARNWYQKAADAGNADAMRNLGILYENGQGVAKDYIQAKNWYQKAAVAGDTDAKEKLANWRYGKPVVDKATIPQKLAEAKNHYVKKEYTKAFAIYDGLDEADLDLNAKHYLGYMYSVGQGVSQDFVQAKKWYQQAADGGKVAAMYNLAAMYESGQGVTRDYSQAKNWYQKAADAGDRDAKEKIANWKH